MLCDLMSGTGVLGRPASFYRPESIPDRAAQLGINHEPGSEEFERPYLAAIRKEGSDATGTFGLRLMWETIEDLRDRLSPLFPDQQNDADLFECAFGHPLYIHLVREDKVAQAVSLVRAKQSGQWHLASDGTVRQGAMDPSPITYDVQAIEQEIASLSSDDAAWEKWFAAQRLSPVQVTYEELANSPAAVIAALLRALGCDPTIAQSVAPLTSKMADDESRQWADRYRQGSH
ncbi:MAG: Stf0 sulfotransferase [Rhodobiaceae bacterium]|nr:Stf0 sulfotransferase [Rhodobiaceae bacterium]